MLKLGQILKEHKIAFIFAFLVSIITIFPQIYFRSDHHDIYRGVELLPDSPWSARVREVQDGHPNFGSIYYKDGKDNPYLFQPLGSMVVAYMGQALSLDINDTILLSRIVLPFVTFILIYTFIFLLSRERLTALSAAAVLLLADSVLSLSGLLRIFHGLSPDSFLRLARPVNPAMIYIFLFAFLVTFWIFYRNRDWRYGIASAVLLGLNFYNYFYSWTYLYAFGAILGLLLIIQKKWRDVGMIAAVYVGALVVAIPYVINLYRVTSHPVYEEASIRSGIVFNHDLVFVGMAVIAALIVFFAGFPREDREKYFFGLSLLLAPFLTLNQQILTGKILQEAHYHWFFHKPIGIIFVLIVVFYFLTKRRMLFTKKIFAILIITASVGTAVFIQVSSYFNDTRDGGEVAIERQRYGTVMDWLNQYAEKESVVLATDEISHLTAIYTPLNLFYHRAAGYSLAATKSRLLDVLFTFYRLRGVGEDADGVFFAERGFISASVYVIHYRELLGSYEAIPDEEIQKIIDLYKTTLSVPTSVWLQNTLSTYEVEYIVWDKKNDPLWKLDQYAFLEKKADFGDLLIYSPR